MWVFQHALLARDSAMSVCAHTLHSYVNRVDNKAEKFAGTANYWCERSKGKQLQVLKYMEDACKYICLLVIDGETRAYCSIAQEPSMHSRNFSRSPRRDENAKRELKCHLKNESEWVWSHYCLAQVSLWFSIDRASCMMFLLVVKTKLSLPTAILIYVSS